MEILEGNAIDHRRKEQVQTAAGIDPTLYGHRLTQVLQARKEVAIELLRGHHTIDGRKALDQLFDYSNDKIKKILGL